MEKNFLKDEFEIKGMLDQHMVKNYVLIPDHKYGFVVNVDGSVVLPNRYLAWFPVKFNRVNGDFNLVGNRLISLEFMPEHIGGDCYLSGNKLTSLVGVSGFIGGDFYCDNNLLKNLIGLSNTTIGGSFDCSNNLLESLEGSPKIIYGYFSCAMNKLKSLLFCPLKTGDFYCNNNELISLKYCPDEVGQEFCCGGNDISTLEFFPKIFGGYMEIDSRCLPHLDCSGIYDFDFYYDAHRQEIIEKNKLKLEQKIDDLTIEQKAHQKNNKI
jgi:hypothetical protein